MTRDEHLLCCLAEECAEVAQRVSKALRFGLNEVQEGQPLNNAERIVEELYDLFAVAEIIRREGLFPEFFPIEGHVTRKRAKIETYMQISRATGALTPEPSSTEPPE